jgi:predicted metal-dependent enzyme (double-stranded beta helix superfamily)
MSYTLEDLAADCHAALAADPGPAGRETVRRHLETALKDKAFVAAHLGPDNDIPRQQLYRDPDFGFCIMAHVYDGAKTAPPHDHADTWAIYGQAKGTTEMTEWRKVKAPEGDAPGLVEPAKVYDLKPGMAVVYNEGVLHSPRRAGPTRLIRIEGRNLDGVQRDLYEPAADTAPAQ